MEEVNQKFASALRVVLVIVVILLGFHYHSNLIPSSGLGS
jgi:hypothetical protein